QTLLITADLMKTDGGNGDADTVGSAVFSADGRYVAFEDTASNLVPGDNNRDGYGNGANDVFVRDLSAGNTALASVRSPPLPAAYTSLDGAILTTGYADQSPADLGSVSADGRYVAFTSSVFYSTHFSDLAALVT